MSEVVVSRESGVRSKKVILASGSAARAGMLHGAGLTFEVIPADVDEGAVQGDAGKTPFEIAAELAQLKALAVSAQRTDALVIGGDQVLAFEGEIFSKSSNAQEAKGKLARLSGKMHSLISSVALARGDEIIWAYTDEARLYMHDLGPDFLDDYIAKAGIALTRAVGGYELESHGSWLFERIEGDYFTVLGMPLLPLLARLREEGISL